MNPFLYGSLARIEQRVARLRQKQSGFTHNLQIEPLVPNAGESPTVTVTVESNRSVDQILCYITQPEDRVVSLLRRDVRWDILNWTYQQVWQAALPAYPDGTLVRYHFAAFPSSRVNQPSREPIPVENGQRFSYLVGDATPPEWSRGAVIYQIFPDRFSPGRDRDWNVTEKLGDIHGGTLRGIIEELDYVADLGFNCIWLNPFFPDHTHHGYHATDYFSVNPRLGSMEDIEELVAEAHRRKIYLLLDFVANHWGSNHWTFKEAQANRDSPYYDWYFWKSWPDDYATYYTVKDLPKINVDHPDARSHLLDSVEFWLGEVGFDGLRLDHVVGPSHDFWTELRAVAREVKPDAWLIGEATDTPAVQLSYAGRFDGCLDFMLLQALRDTFASGAMDVAAFDAFLTQHETFFPSSFSRPSFLDNHDMNRFLWIVQGDKRKLKLAALCQFTLSGPPIVYNGTEVGVSQERSIEEPGSEGMVECRQPMSWGDAQDQDLHAFYRRLIRFRRQNPLLWRTRRQTVHVDAELGTYAYLYADGEDMILVALNASGGEQRLTVELPEYGLRHTFALGPWQGDVYARGHKGVTPLAG